MNDTSQPMLATLATAVADSMNPPRRNQPVEIVEDTYRNHYADLFRYLLFSGCDEADAREFLQEAFLRLVRHLREGKTVDTPKHWLLRVLHNIRCNEYRRTARYVDVEAGDLEAIVNRLAADAPSAEAVMLNRERYQRVRAAMASLTGRQHQCILLRANGLKLREIADLFGGISAVTVAEACGRAMEKLGRLKYE